MFYVGITDDVRGINRFLGVHVPQAYQLRFGLGLRLELVLGPLLQGHGQGWEED